MKRHCQHCSTTCPPGDPFDGFCCAGCRSVYALIHDSGLEDFYALQDRAGRPVGAESGGRRPLPLEHLQARAREVPGGFVATLYVSGMTCRGCAWLVERLTRRQSGVRGVAVSLTSGRMELEWGEGFDFMELQAELARYGYALAASALPGLRLSPLALRWLLGALFAANGGLLCLLVHEGIGGPELTGLYELLLLANLLLQWLVGASVFVRPAWDALRMRHWHSDLLPAGFLAAAFVAALFERVANRPEWVFTGGFLFAVLVCLSARLLADRLSFRATVGQGS